jgi:hypothetical protein
MTDTTNPQQAAPVCKFEEGCHRVVACEPGCAAATVPASAPTDQAALRSDLEDALKGAGVYDSKERMWHSLSPEWIEEILTEVLAVLPAPADRAAILRAEAEHLIRDLYPAVYDDAGQKTALGVNRAARELLDRADAAELRRMADASGPGGVAGETQQPDPAAPELTAEEARALVDQMGLDLYRAQDAIEFARECCDIADREQRPVTTADVREWLKGDRCTRQRAADEEQPETQADDEGLRAKVDDATSTLRRIRSAIRTLKEQGATGQTYHQVITNALAGPRPDEAPEPETEEDIVREHVTTVHLIGEQLADVESYLWERLADVRAEQPAAVSQPDGEA